MSFSTLKRYAEETLRRREMRTLLIILTLFSFIQSSGQNVPPNDAVYRLQKNQYGIVYDKPKVKRIEISDTALLLWSDNGKINIEKENFEISLQYRDKKYNYTQTTLRKDSLVLFLFRNDILNYDNLLKSATADRTAINQYGDTINTTIHVDCSTIKIYDIVWTNHIETKKTKTFTFYLNFIFENNPYSIYHFCLSIRTDKNISNVREILSTIPKLKYLKYSGFEI
jgi:hypothetical protein